MGGLKIVFSQKWQLVINYMDCFSQIPERKGSISPVSFHGPSLVFASFAFLMLNVFSCQEK